MSARVWRPALLAQALEPLRALRGRPFALVWAGQTLSRVGDHLFQIALAWWVLEQTGSAAAMATLLIAGFAPMLVCLLLGGALVDRASRVLVMLRSDLLRCAVAALVALLAWAGRLELWHLYALNLAFGVVDAFFQPAYAAIVPDLVSDDDLPSANMLTGASTQLGRIAGPALGALIVALGGAPLAFALNALTFLLAGVLLVPLLRAQHQGAPAQQPQPGPLLAEIREGLAAVRATPWLWRTILLFALGNVALGGPYGIALPLLVSGHLGLGVEALGLLYALFAAGYLAGGLWLARSRQVRRRGRLIYLGVALAGLALAAFGLPLPYLALGLAACVNGALLEIGAVAWTSAMQQYVPRGLLGRVSSIDALGSLALIPLGYAATGWATDLLGAPLVFLIGGALTALVAVLAFATQPAIQALD
jgi:hypothetical protein